MCFVSCGADAGTGANSDVSRAPSICVWVVCICICDCAKPENEYEYEYEYEIRMFFARLELRIHTPIPTEKGEWYTIDLSVFVYNPEKYNDKCNKKTNTQMKHTNIHTHTHTLTDTQTKQMKWNMRSHTANTDRAQGPLLARPPAICPSLTLNFTF